MTLLEELQLFKEVEIKYVSRWRDQSENRKAVEYLEGKTNGTLHDEDCQSMDNTTYDNVLKF